MTHPYYAPPWRSRGAESSSLFETSGDVEACANRVEAQARSLDTDIANALKKRWKVTLLPSLGKAVSLDSKTGDDPAFVSDAKFYEAWRRFVNNDWAPWRQETVTGPPDGPKPISIMSADDFRECQRYGKDVQSWRERAAKRGWEVTAPKSADPGPIPGFTDPASEAEEKKALPWGWIVFGAVLFGGAMLLGQVRSLLPSRAP